MKAYIVSLGCPKNLTDTEVIMGNLVTQGYTITNDPAQADTIIVNTCAFLKSARDESKQIIREMAKWKKKGKCKQLLIAGCLPKVEKTSSEKVDGIVDSIKLYNCNTPRIKATLPWYAYVKIAEGCNNKCAYCLIPKIRGKLRNRPVDDVLAEVKQLAKRGVKELIFIAQDTTAHPEFAVILRKTAHIGTIRWIRAMYTHPAHISDKLIKVIAQEKKIVKYLDLPIQHANDKILEQMNRRYTRLDLEKFIAKIRRRIPEIALRTSVIVGFPGESEAKFKELYNFIKRVRFDRLGVFTYEREKGTLAYKMRGQVSEKKKKERFHKLMRLQRRISKGRNNKLIGKTLETIIEGAEPGRFIGRTTQDAPEIDGQVFINNSRTLKPGEIVKIKVRGAKAYDLIGYPV